jgi:addiction module HigA family antidote
MNKHPGDILANTFMRPLGLSAYRISRDLGVAPIAVSQILRRRRAISPSMALKLGAYFGVDPAFWLALQSDYDLQVAEQAAMEPGTAGSFHVERCRALNGRSVVLRHSKTGGLIPREVSLTGEPPAAVRSTVATASAAQPKRTNKKSAGIAPQSGR